MTAQQVKQQGQELGLPEWVTDTAEKLYSGYYTKGTIPAPVDLDEYDQLIKDFWNDETKF